MRLLIDLGHTRLKWAWAREAHVERGGAMTWRRGALLDVLDIIAQQTRVPPAHIGVAAVAREAPRSELQQRLEQLFGLVASFLGTTEHCAGVTCGYDDPASLGVDRWAALIGAWRRATGHAAVVVDAGSALTVDLLAPNGRHLGGCIAPGLALSRTAFYSRTARPELTGQADPRGLARNTADAVATGALLAAAGTVEALWRRSAVKRSQPLLWLTGGDAPALSAVLEVSHEVVPDLVFEGMDVMLGGRE